MSVVSTPTCATSSWSFPAEDVGSGEATDAATEAAGSVTVVDPAGSVTVVDPAGSALADGSDVTGWSAAGAVPHANASAVSAPNPKATINFVLCTQWSLSQ